MASTVMFIEVKYEKLSEKIHLTQFFCLKNIRFLVLHTMNTSIRPEMTLSHIPNNVRILNLENESFRFIGIATKPNLSPATKKLIECVHSWLSIHNSLDF